nr:hypothetical protein [Pontibacter vulgaris]
MAQSGVKPALDAVPAATATSASAPAAATTVPAAVKPSFAGPRLNYNLSAGASFNSQFGGATYVEPSVRYNVTNRFRAHASFTYLNVLPHNETVANPEGGTMLRRTGSTGHYIVSAGGDYLVNNRLILSGNIWKDFSNTAGQNNLYNNFYSPGRYGADFKATYKITEHFTVTGGLRYTDGALPYYNSIYGPGYGSYQSNPFGY